MGKTFGAYKYSIGDIFSKPTGNMMILKMDYSQVARHKNNVDYMLNQKMYQYRCLNCGNEDWIREDCLAYKDKYGCNACCQPPKKVICGINDVSTTAPWMMRYFVDLNDAFENTKYSKSFVNMKCPHCGKISKKQIHQVMSNHGLSCPCGDTWSYPNKFMYSLLDQIGVCFETEKHFDWSGRKSYDDYIEFCGLRIITEQNGKQHYTRSLIGNDIGRNVEQEMANDLEKLELAKNNGIDYYFQIDCSYSDAQHIKTEILRSGLLDVFGLSESDIDWDKCDEFALGNMVKSVCKYRDEHKEMSADEIGKIFHISRITVYRYCELGSKYGWCSNDTKEYRKIRESFGLMNHGQKRIYCETNGQYYESSNKAGASLFPDIKRGCGRQIRKSIERGQRYRGYKFIYADNMGVA